LQVRIDDCGVQGFFMADDQGNISVRGRIDSVAHAPCANCLKDASAPVENEFDEEFIRNGDPEDDEIFAYEGHRVSLEKLVMSYAVMALPIRFLCREDCPGFEYTDRTETSGETGVQHPFAGLRQLLDQMEEV